MKTHSKIVTKIKNRNSLLSHKQEDSLYKNFTAEELDEIIFSRERKILNSKIMKPTPGQNN